MEDLGATNSHARHEGLPEVGFDAFEVLEEAPPAGGAPDEHPGGVGRADALPLLVDCGGAQAGGARPACTD